MREDIEFVENNDPIAEFVCTRSRLELDGTTTSTPQNLQDALIECYVKTGKDVADDDPSTILYSSDTPGDVTVVDEASGICQVNFEDVTRTHNWYHLDVVKDGRRLTFAYGKIKVVDV